MVEFTTVTERHDYIAIVGSGSSLKNIKLDIPAKVAIIAVNGAVHILNRFDYWFTLDPSPRNYTIMSKPKPNVIYYAAVPSDYGQPTARIAGMRQQPGPHMRFLRRIEGYGHGRLRTRCGVPRARDRIHTGNSGWGAFQLACHMNARKIALFGLDGHGRYAYDRRRPTHLQPMPDLFLSAVEHCQRNNIKVVNASINSKIECFPKKTIQQTIEWLNDD